MAVPLTAITRNDKLWLWTQHYQTAFTLLKNQFTSTPKLAHFDSSLQSIIEIDASNYRIGAVHSQVQRNGKVQLCAFLSGKFSPTELNYDIHNKEIVAIVLAFIEWEYLFMVCYQKIVIWTNHKNLQYFTLLKVLTRHQPYLSEFLSKFDFVVEYRPSDKNVKPDGLSRCSDLCPEGGSEHLQLMHFLIKPGQPQISVAKMFHLYNNFKDILRAGGKLDPP